MLDADYMPSTVPIKGGYKDKKTSSLGQRSLYTCKLINAIKCYRCYDRNTDKSECGHK